jgi:hypothetical protein
MRHSVGSILKRMLPVLVLCPFLTGCCTQMFGKAIKKVRNQAPGATDVAVILLEPDKTYYPERLIVRNKAHMVVWIAEADELKVEFKDPSQTGGVVTKCPPEIPFLCYSSAPFDLPQGTVIKYKATLRCKGKDPVTIDPEVEIVF